MLPHMLVAGSMRTLRLRRLRLPSHSRLSLIALHLDVSARCSVWLTASFTRWSGCISSDFPSTDQLRNRLRRSANRLCKVFLGSVCHPIMHNRLAGIITRAARGFLFQRRRCRRIDMPRLIRWRQTCLNILTRFDDPLSHHVIGYVVRICSGGGAIICDAIVFDRA